MYSKLVDYLTQRFYQESHVPQYYSPVIHLNRQIVLRSYTLFEEYPKELVVLRLQCVYCCKLDGGSKEIH